MTNRTNLEMENFDNIYLIRFKVLYAYYNEYFFGSRNLFKTTPMSKNDSEFISKTLLYLEQNDYLRMIPKDNDEATFHIKFKGIKLVDKITDGDVEFTDDEINKSKVKIISMFQKEDINVS
jgi:hypothetical protein